MRQNVGPLFARSLVLRRDERVEEHNPLVGVDAAELGLRLVLHALTDMHIHVVEDSAHDGVIQIRLRLMNALLRPLQPLVRAAFALLFRSCLRHGVSAAYRDNNNPLRPIAGTPFAR